MARKKTKKKRVSKSVEVLTHDEAKRSYIPTAEYQSVMDAEQQKPIQVAYDRRNPDLDPQLVWRGKDVRDWSDLVVQASPLFIQEKVHPKVLIDDLMRQSERTGHASKPQIDLFADFNGLDEEARTTEFYEHDANWTNRMILGDSLQVMASLAEREGLRGKVQCIYIDPPYGIKFNSNFQWSTTSRSVKDGNAGHITREPEQVKAFRDTWRDGIHSYLTYLQARLAVSRDLLKSTGSIFVQIGDENVHRLRSLLDEVFGEANFVSEITMRKTTSEGSRLIGSTCDFILWYAKDIDAARARTLYAKRSRKAELRYRSEYFNGKLYRTDTITSSRPAGEGDVTKFDWFERSFTPGKGTFKTTAEGLERLAKADRLEVSKGGKLSYRRFQDDFGFTPVSNLWSDISGAVQSRSDPKVYVVQTSTSVVQRCLLLASDPGDLVLDPTCGAGTTAYAAEQWGRRWITIDTSRVALALARARIMGARYPYYLLRDSRSGQLKEAEVVSASPSEAETFNSVRQGFVCERVPHITLGSIANNSELEVIWDGFEKELEPLRLQLNEALGEQWEEWGVPHDAQADWPKETTDLHAAWWALRIARQKKIDESIAAKAEPEHFFDRPFEDKTKVRVAGPFTVESLSPHRVLSVGANDELIETETDSPAPRGERLDFAGMILANLETAGVQQAHKEDKIDFSSLVGWPGKYVCAEGRYLEGGTEGSAERRPASSLAPEFGTVSRPDLVAAAREAGDAGFDLLISCAFNYDAHSADFDQLGRIPVLKAHMNADLHMADDLKKTSRGNLFVIFGEPDIDIFPREEEGEGGQIQVRINGVDVFHPQTGEVRSDGADGIACWFIDTDYNEESFFVRHAYFLGATDPYKSLKTTLKAEIDPEVWATLNSDTSRPFHKPSSGRIAVKVINHLGDEVMKVFSVS